MDDDRAELGRLMQRFLRAVSFGEGEQPAIARVDHRAVDFPARRSY
jgi:hypothetical protein